MATTALNMTPDQIITELAVPVEVFNAITNKSLGKYTSLGKAKSILCLSCNGKMTDLINKRNNKPITSFSRKLNIRIYVKSTKS